MIAISRWGRRLLLRSPSPPRRAITTGFGTLDTTQKVEEEAQAWYQPENWYPVRIGAIFNVTYQVLSKLGYGAYSTVWLCRDLKAHSYVTIKVCERNSVQARREVKVYQHLNAITSRHSGSRLVRTLLDAFEINSSDGNYQCLVHKPLGMSLSNLQARSPFQRLPENLLKLTLIHILLALDFLHTEALVIHTDLQPRNILLDIEDKSILSELEEREKKIPSPRKVNGDRVIYTSQQLKIPGTHGRPVLCDFGEARFGGEGYDDDIQPYIYRAPEVILHKRWNNKVDIWNVGVMAWDLFEDKHLFHAKDQNNENSSLHHIAEMIALLGPPPSEFIRRSKLGSEYFDAHGKGKGLIDIPVMSFEDSEENLNGEEKVLFLAFLRKMLSWVPEGRKTAKELLRDPWLKG
ncbi:hypothetical protein MMC11_001850 [Xylographa trunciseda]|nr:hypothetical protein [Xylographa trunciseda]